MNLSSLNKSVLNEDVDIDRKVLYKTDEGHDKVYVVALKKSGPEIRVISYYGSMHGNMPDEYLDPVMDTGLKRVDNGGYENIFVAKEVMEKLVSKKKKAKSGEKTGYTEVKKD